MQLDLFFLLLSDLEAVSIQTLQPKLISIWYFFIALRGIIIGAREVANGLIESCRLLAFAVKNLYAFPEVALEGKSIIPLG